MNKYLSVILLYNKASRGMLTLIIGALPLFFTLLFLIKTGNPFEASPNMLVENAFGGVIPVLVFIIVNLLAVLAVSNSLNENKSMKFTSSSTTGYLMRRLQISPSKTFVTVFVYYLSVVVLIWGIAIASLYIIGRIGLAMAGATDINTMLALGLLRTDIGHALIPYAHPTIMVFNVVIILALAGEGAKSSYLRWHNGSPSAGILVSVAIMFAVWSLNLENHYIILALAIFACYVFLSFVDIIYREKRPKGDPFKVNKHGGIIDIDLEDLDDALFVLQENKPDLSDEAKDASELANYGRIKGKTKQKFEKFGFTRMRRRYLPLGINIEKANTFLGICIFIGAIEHLVFLGKYLLKFNELKISITGVILDFDLMMPYFWELEAHSYYGYIIGIILAFVVQAYWNYEYYNKKTKSVYVMKRLPDTKEYPRTIWVAPAIQSLAIVVIMVVHTLVDLGIYVLLTPDIALQPDYLAHILPF